MNRFTRHPRLVKRFLKACRSSSVFMTGAELASLSDLSSCQVARFIRTLEAQGYMFRKRVRQNRVTEYRLIIEPLEYRNRHFEEVVF
jgi:DNA-binding MurR/RpiR family transcriptional regulator